MKLQRNPYLIITLKLIILYWLSDVSLSKDLSGRYGYGDIIHEFDFIVAGAGAAGCVVAGRLSENGNYSVLLIEIGDEPHPGLEVAALLPKYHKESGAVKRYPSVPQKTAALKNGGVINYLVGQALGGTAAVNAMIFNRGSPYDYDHWAALTGDLSWKYENVLEYFKKIEDYRGEFPSESQHGRGGLITITQPKYLPGKSEWQQAGQFLGHPTADPNGPQKISFNPIEYNKKFGRRVSSYHAYIKPFLETRPYLKVLTNSAVKRVEFDGNRAIGVLYESTVKGRKALQVAKARREVIISAGVIGSAAILMRSGIGPADVLKSAGISPMKYLAVGQNLHDHTAVQLNWILNSRSQVFIPERDLNPQTWAYYNQFGDGPYSAYVIQLQAFLASSVATPPPPTSSTTNAKSLASPSLWPDTHLMYGQTTMSASGINKEFVGALPFEQVVSSSVLVGRPKSAGSVVLNSTDPFNSDPLVDFNFYSHPDDMTVMLEGIQTSLKIFEKSPAYVAAGARYPSVPLPECKDIQFRSEDYWRCYLRERTTTGLHGAGTCKMGRGEEDPTAVVDSKLKVIGIEGLRVVDVSIMPNVTNSNTMVPAYMIGEKAAAMIIAQYHQRLY